MGRVFLLFRIHPDIVWTREYEHTSATLTEKCVQFCCCCCLLVSVRKIMRTRRCAWRVLPIDFIIIQFGCGWVKRSYFCSQHTFGEGVRLALNRYYWCDWPPVDALLWILIGFDRCEFFRFRNCYPGSICHIAAVLSSIQLFVSFFRRSFTMFKARDTILGKKNRCQRMNLISWDQRNENKHPKRRKPFICR